MTRELFKRGNPRRRVSWTRNMTPRRRDWGRILANLLRGSVAVAVAAGAVWAGPPLAATVRDMVFREESLTARRLVLEGNRLVSRELITTTLGIGDGDTLVNMDVGSMAARLERLPAVKSALVKKQYPSALYIRITERRPLMIVLDGAERRLVDDEGVVMGGDGVTGEEFPLVSGVTLTRGRVADPTVTQVLAGLRDASLAAGLGWPGVFPVVDFSSPEGPVGFVAGVLPVRLGRGGYPDKMARFASVLPRLGAGQASPVYVDLRFDRRVVVGTRPEEPKSPEKEQVKTVG
jgi:cell division protein FtsQ